MNATSSRSSTVPAALVRKAAFRSRRALGLVAAAVAGLLAFGLSGSAAFASIPAPRGGAAVPATTAVAPTIKVISTGLTTSQVALIAAGAALLGAAVVLLALRLRPARRAAAASAA